ncbi:MAG: M48 family peptidase, partial [Fluviibacter sp.]
MSDITLAFLALVFFNLTIRFWLYQRQAVSVIRHRSQVPEAFSTAIGLDDHQKAADYTVAKMRLGQMQLWVETVWLLALTLGGGINSLYGWALDLTSADTPLLTGLIFLAMLGVGSGAVDLPFAIYRQFGLEARFGFN